MSTFWPQHRGAELGMSADIFGNYDVPYEEESRVTRSKQCNVWHRTISIRTDLSTGRRTSTTYIHTYIHITLFPYASHYNSKLVSTWGVTINICTD